MALPARAVLLSFEGPDRYASIGGLATRVTQLARALGATGTKTDLIFVGDPASMPVQDDWAPNVTLRRWSQWISAFHPRSCYDGEDDKVRDWDASVPQFVVDQVLAPAAALDQRVLVIAEEWQTANVAIAIDRIARARGLRHDLILIWNANNTYGWHNIDWDALQRAAAISAVSKYMKFELSRWNVPALVIPNGIDDKLLAGPDPELVSEAKRAFGGRPTLIKVGRFDPDKNWLQAVDALAGLQRFGIDARLIVRGGREPYGEVVFGRAHEHGLRVERMDYDGNDGRRIIEELGRGRAPIVHVRAYLDEPTLFALYAASDAVLANSGKEPFGLVGLEVMAAGGIAVCGATGEEYAEPFVNAIVCDTADGRELASYLRALLTNPDVSRRLRVEGAETASKYTWPHSLDALERKLAYIDAIAS
jgi:glycosyltransferase involved in cell wall biosynthesis